MTEGVVWARVVVLVGSGWAAAHISAQSPSQLLKAAYTNREAVKAAQLQLEAAKRTAGFQSTYPGTRVEFGRGTEPDVSGGEDLTLFQPIDVFNKTGALRASARATVRAAQATYRQALLDVQHQVLTSYATWANEIRMLQSAKDQLTVALAAQKATNARVAARSLPEIENIRAGLETRRNEQAVVDHQAAVDASVVKLRQATGAEVNGEPQGLEAKLITDAMPDRTRPDLMNLFAQNESYDAELRQASNSLLPDVEVQARRSPWSTPEQYGLRLQFVLPLWDHGAARDRSAAAKRNKAAAELQITDLHKRVQSEIEAADIQVKAAQKSLDAYQELLAGARDLAAKTQRGFELGAATLIEVYDAKRVLNDTTAGLAGAQLNLDLAVEAALAARGQLLEANP